MYSQSLVMFGDGEELLADIILDDDNVGHQGKMARDIICNLATRFDKSENLAVGGEVKRVIDESVTPLSLSQLCVVALHRAGPGHCPAEPSGWASSTAQASWCQVIGMRSIVKERATLKGAVKRDRHITWQEFHSELSCALSTPGTKLRSSKQFIAMSQSSSNTNTDTNRVQFVFSQGDKRLECYGNDITVGDPLPRGVSHVKEIKRGNIRFEYTDRVVTQTAPRNTGREVANVSVEIQRELDIVDNNKKFHMSDTMSQIITPSLAELDSPSALNSGFIGDRAGDSETDKETPRASPSGTMKDPSQSPMDTGTPHV